VEYSTLEAIDFAIGKFLVNIYDNQPLNGPANWRSFLQRPTKKKILRGEFDTVSDILKTIESTEKHASQTGPVKANPVNLPLIAYTRKPSITVADPDAAAYLRDSTVLAPDGVTDLSISLAQLSLEYQICMMAFDRPTLESMQLAWVFALSKQGAKQLSYDVMIAGCQLEIQGSIIDPLTPLFSNASLPIASGRLFAVMLPITVRIYAVMGAEIDIPETLRWIVYSPADNYSGPGGSNEGGLWGDDVALGGSCDGGVCWPNKK